MKLTLNDDTATSLCHQLRRGLGTDNFGLASNINKLLKNLLSTMEQLDDEEIQNLFQDMRKV